MYRQRQCGFAPKFFLYLWLDVEICAVLPEDFSLLFAGVTWWKRLAEITEEQGSPLEQESKSVWLSASLVMNVFSLRF